MGGGLWRRGMGGGLSSVTLGIDRGPNTLKAHPHPRVHYPSHTSLQGVVHPACRA